MSEPITLWRTPAGRLHLRQTCPGMLDPDRAVEVMVGRGQEIGPNLLAGRFITGYVCHCADQAVRAALDAAIEDADVARGIVRALLNTGEI